LQRRRGDNARMVESLRVVLVSTMPPVVLPLDRGLRAAGHQPVAVITHTREGSAGNVSLMEELAPDLDVLVPSAKERLAPLLRACEPDLLLCAFFPWLIPPDALAVPRIGAVNFHPSLLPRYRGPNPIGWTFRNDDPEYGLTLHRMDETFDTGGILAQVRVPVEDDDHFSNIGRKFEPYAAGLLTLALERLAAGDRGDPQSEEGASEAPRMEDEWAEIDWSRPAREVHNQVRSWVITSPSGLKGALTELDGERVRVVRTSLHPRAEGEAEPGTIVGREDDLLLVQCGDRPIWVLQTEQP
jgi:methionyl-tRNA formyltransferase